jgi:hypothetical protein
MKQTLCYVPKKNLVLAPTGSKNVYEVEHSQAKATLTVMCTFSASGKTCLSLSLSPPSYDYISSSEDSTGNPPQCSRKVVCWAKRQRVDKVRSIFRVYWECILSISCVKQHSIASCIVRRWPQNPPNLLPECAAQGTADISHRTLSKFYKNSAAADVAAFRPIKSKWKDAVLSWQTQNPNKAVTKEDFDLFLKTCLKTLTWNP